MESLITVTIILALIIFLCTRDVHEVPPDDEDF